GRSSHSLLVSTHREVADAERHGPVMERAQLPCSRRKVFATTRSPLFERKWADSTPTPEQCQRGRYRIIPGDAKGTRLAVSGYLSGNSRADAAAATCWLRPE